MKPRFNGSDYVPARDDARLAAQHSTIKQLMRDRKWRTLGEIEAVTGYPQASISAQLRHLRKKRFGAFIIEKKYLGRGLYAYRMAAE